MWARAQYLWLHLQHINYCGCMAHWHQYEEIFHDNLMKWAFATVYLARLATMLIRTITLSSSYCIDYYCLYTGPSTIGLTLIFCHSLLHCPPARVDLTSTSNFCRSSMVFCAKTFCRMLRRSACTFLFVSSRRTLNNDSRTFERSLT